jgi:hypothetical protein
MFSDGPRLEDVKRLVREGRYRLTLQAEHEREQDRILAREIEEALCLPRTEIVEDYPTDTLYRPDSGRWIEWRERRGGGSAVPRS